MLMWFDALNERGRLKISFLALFVSSTAGFVGLAMFQTVFGGYVSPWWLIAGFFLWLLVMMPAIFGMARLQRRAETLDKGFLPGGARGLRADPPPGDRRLGPGVCGDFPVLFSRVVGGVGRGVA